MSYNCDCNHNSSKTFIVGIVIFVLLVVGGFAFFAKEDTSQQNVLENKAAPIPASSNVLQ